MITPNDTAYSAPSIANNGTATVITVRGRDNSLKFYWATNGVAEWHKHPVHGPALEYESVGTYSAPSIAMTSTTAVITALGRVRHRETGKVINTLQFYWNTRGAPEWHKSPTTETYGPNTPPSIANNGNSTVIAAKSGVNLGVYWAVNGTDTWHYEPVGRPYT